MARIEDGQVTAATFVPVVRGRAMQSDFRHAIGPTTPAQPVAAGFAQRHVCVVSVACFGGHPNPIGCRS